MSAIRPATVPLRFYHLMTSIPDFLEHKKVLYIGGNKARLQLVPELYWAGCNLDIVEIFPPYIKELHEVNMKRPYFTTIRLGDVTKLDQCIGNEKWDMVVWWHGMEHIDEEMVPRAIDQCYSACTKLAVFGCPHDTTFWCKQGVTKDGNRFQRHISCWNVDKLKSLNVDLEVASLKPDPGGNDSHLIAWARHF